MKDVISSKQEDGKIEAVRPVARVTARELTLEEMSRVGGGISRGYSNFGGENDTDLQN